MFAGRCAQGNDDPRVVRIRPSRPAALGRRAVGPAGPARERTAGGRGAGPRAAGRGSDGLQAQRPAPILLFAERVAVADARLALFPAEHDRARAALAGDVHGHRIRPQDGHAEVFQLALAAAQGLVVLADAGVELGELAAQALGSPRRLELLALA